MPRVLVVDDERPIADILRYHLERQGFEVKCAYTGPEALEAAERDTPDLVILDLMLPGMDGFEVCRTLRQRSQVPILILTARDDEVDKVVGLELGADDYVTKPFSPREVVARVKAHLRRAAAPAPAADVVTIGAIRLDSRTYTAFKSERPLALTRREFELLRFLCLHAGQVFSRETLLDEVWGFEYLGDIRTVDVTVRRLREKIEDDPSDPECILTRRGVGYYVTRPGD